MRFRELFEDNHTVMKGDTLWDLSRKYGVPMDQIAKASGMKSVHDVIRPGQKLVIPGKPPTVAPTPAPVPAYRQPVVQQPAAASPAPTVAQPAGPAGQIAATGQASTTAPVGGAATIAQPPGQMTASGFGTAATGSNADAAVAARTGLAPNGQPVQNPVPPQAKPMAPPTNVPPIPAGAASSNVLQGNMTSPTDDVLSSQGLANWAQNQAPKTVPNTPNAMNPKTTGTPNNGSISPSALSNWAQNNKATLGQQQTQAFGQNNISSSLPLKKAAASL